MLRRDGSGIVGFAVNGFNVHDNTLTNNGVWGIAHVASQHAQIVNNSVSGSTDTDNPSQAGIYVADSPNAATLVRRNTVTNSQFGIDVSDSAHGQVAENKATGNCVGILLIDTVQPGDAFDWTLVHNTADNNTKGCPGGDEGSTMAVGISVVGARNSRLTANHATGNAGAGLSTFGAGGIVVMSGAGVGGSDPSNVQVDHNQLKINAPSTDLSYDGSGKVKTNTFGSNVCTTSSPAGLC